MTHSQANEWKGRGEVYKGMVKECEEKYRNFKKKNGGVKGKYMGVNSLHEFNFPKLI